MPTNEITESAAAPEPKRPWFKPASAIRMTVVHYGLTAVVASPVHGPTLVNSGATVRRW